MKVCLFVGFKRAWLDMQLFEMSSCDLIAHVCMCVRAHVSE